MKNKFAALFSPVITFLKSAIKRLSAQDGKPGLSEEDIAKTVEKVVMLAQDGTAKAVKAQQLAHYIRVEFFGKLPTPGGAWDWIPWALGWAAVLIAKRSGLVG